MTVPSFLAEKKIEEECAPFQYSLSTRDGTDCVGHSWRAATDTSQATLLSVDGVGAFDHVEVFRIATGVRICEKKSSSWFCFFSLQEQDALRAPEILGIGEN